MKTDPLEQDEADRPAGRRRNWSVSILVLYTLILCALGVAYRDRALSPGISFWDLKNPEQLLEFLGMMSLAGLIEVLRFSVVGFFIALALGRAERLRGVLAKIALCVLVSAALATLVRSVDVGAPAGRVSLILPLVGCLLGIWIGTMWARGPRARLWLLGQVSLLALFIGGGGAIVLSLAIDSQPLPFSATEVTSQEKRRLVDLIKRARDDQPADSGVVRLRLTQRDVDLLLAWGLSIFSEGRKSHVQFQQESMDADVSFRLPESLGTDHYFNVQSSGRLSVNDGQLQLSFDRLRVGRLSLPVGVVNFFIPSAVEVIRDDPDLAALLDSIQRVQLQSGAIEVVADHDRLPRGTLSSLLERLGARSDVLAATRVQVRHLISVADDLPQGDDRFGALMAAAFTLAGQRSRQSDPVLENRAAIYALTMMLGHPKFERLIGHVVEPESKQASRQYLGSITLRGRRDWTRHYWVSAGLAAISANVLSDALGLLKEELDAGAGGSGFSFSDLQADRAGVLFVHAATRDKRSAIAMQRRLSGEFNIDDFFPPAADLPEGIDAAQLTQKYGGVDGEGYRRMKREIERRLQGCSGLR